MSATAGFSGAVAIYQLLQAYQNSQKIEQNWQQRRIPYPVIHTGMVIYNLSYMHCYSVNLDDGRNIIAHDMSMGGLVGVRGGISYPAGCLVLVVEIPGYHHGIILGALPPIQWSWHAGCPSPILVPGSSVGIFGKDDKHHMFLKTAGKSHILCPAGRPVDQLATGELTWNTESGNFFVMDNYTIKAKAGMAEWAVHIIEGLMRLASYKFQHWTTAKSVEEGVFGALPYSYKKGYLLPSDGCGGVRNFFPFIRTENLGDYSRDIKKPVLTIDDNNYVSESYNVQSLGRLVEIEGISAIQTQWLQGDTNHLAFYYDIPEELPGLFTQHLHITGEYIATSAKGFYWIKSSSFPVPKQLKRFEEYDIDVPKKDTIAKNLNITGDDRPPVDKAATILDGLDHRYSWKIWHMFVKLPKTWYLPSYTLADEEDQFLTNVDPYGQLIQEQYYTQSVHKVVSTPVGDIPCFAGPAAIYITDEGEFGLLDASGAEIKTVGGNLMLSAPADIWLCPGRNLIIWSGSDTIIRSQKNIDISSTSRNVRIKASQRAGTVMVTGQGILLDAHSVKPVGPYADVIHPGEQAVLSGLVLRTHHGAPIVATGPAIILSTNPQIKLDTSTSPFDDVDTNYSGEGGGPIVLDASRSHIVEYGLTIHRNSLQNLDIIYQKVPHTSRYIPTQYFVSSNYGFVFSSTPGIGATDVNDDQTYHITPLQTQDKKIDLTLQQQDTSNYGIVNNTLTTSNWNEFMTQLKQQLSGLEEITQQDWGQDYKWCEFSFRQPNEYTTHQEQLKLPAFVWQYRIYRNVGGTPGAGHYWPEEPVYVYNLEDNTELATYPFSGHTNNGITNGWVVSQIPISYDRTRFADSNYQGPDTEYLSFDNYIVLNTPIDQPSDIDFSE